MEAIQVNYICRELIWEWRNTLNIVHSFLSHSPCLKGLLLCCEIVAHQGESPSACSWSFHWFTRSCDSQVCYAYTPSQPSRTNVEQQTRGENVLIGLENLPNAFCFHQKSSCCLKCCLLRTCNLSCFRFNGSNNNSNSNKIKHATTF